MATTAKDIEIGKKESQTPEGIERARAGKVYAPGVDIIEKKDEIVLFADMPGVQEKSVDVTIEKNVLSIYGKVKPYEPDGYRLGSSEYETGDYERTFTLTGEVDRERIQATLKDGVLRLVLPKAGTWKARKIEVTAN
jgi:HSP20 family molecular chaperone IbpA